VLRSNSDQIIRAAGGVLWRTGASGGTEVALVYRPKYGDWSLPKGKLRQGEHPLVTACREVAEETGIRAVVGGRLDVEHYDTAAGPKAVEYWAMHGPDAPFTRTAEVDRLAWLPLDDAARRLSYQRDADALDALKTLAASVVGRSAVLLVRNGHAVPARRWPGSENDRPLDTKGREQADALRRALPAFGPSQLLSAPHARSVDTIRPVGADLGLPVGTERALDEDEFAANPTRGLNTIRELANVAGATAVCAPGAVICHVLAAFADEAGLALWDFRAKKASVWALFFAEGQLVTADYYPAITSPRN